MENKNLKIWDMVKTVPDQFKKKITGGRLNGFTDIKPQWRVLKLTEIFGPCGVGWKYTTKEKKELEAGGLVSVHVWIDLFIKVDGQWSDGIEGQGGSMLLAKEKAGNYHSDEAYKMATTDAISVACKLLGIGSDVYMGIASTKYQAPPKPQPAPVTREQMQKALDACKGVGIEFDDISYNHYLNATGAEAQKLLDGLRKAYKDTSEKQK